RAGPAAGGRARRPQGAGGAGQGRVGAGAGGGGTRRAPPRRRLDPPDGEGPHRRAAAAQALRDGPPRRPRQGGLHRRARRRRRGAGRAGQRRFRRRGGRNPLDCEAAMTQLTEKKRPPARSSYAPATPSALVSFMLRDWKEPPRALPDAIADAAVHAARRRALAALFPGEVLIIPTGHEKPRSNDTIYRFRPSSDFFYLTGNLEPDCVLVMEPRRGGHRAVLYVEPNPGRSDATFFTDRVKGELWVGPRLGVKQSRARFGVDECRPLGELHDAVDRRKGRAWRLLRGHAPALDALLPARDEDRAFATALSEMRLIKDKLELRELQTAIDATRRGFEDVIRALRGARSEREVEGVFHLRARTEGNDVGYGTIAASGRHACILHWTRNDGRLLPGDLLLLDAG